MKRIWLFLGLLVVGAAALSLPTILRGDGRAQAGVAGAGGESRVASVLGVAQVQGEQVFVHIWVVVPPGADESAVADAALREQGARRAGPADLHSAAFSTTGLVWDQFFDATPGNDYVTQYYNPDQDPTGGNGEQALVDSQATWTNVSTSLFAFQYGGETTRCPSLVRECQGPQVYDGFSDVAWLELRGCCTLGVTWYNTGIDEADMALNSRFNWHAGDTSCTNQPDQYDAQTVYLHENGHVVGLDHSEVAGAVMYAYYGGARCILHQDDVDGITALYPSGTVEPTDTPTPAEPTPTSTATATPTPATEPTVTPTSEPGGTATPTPCPPGWYKNGKC